MDEHSSKGASYIQNAGDNRSEYLKMEGELRALRAALRRREGQLRDQLHAHRNSSTRLEFQSDFQRCLQQLERYGEWTHSLKKTAIDPKAPTDEGNKPLKDDSFEFVDPVECLPGKCQKTEEALSEVEEASSGDAFDVNPPDVCGMTAVSAPPHVQWLSPREPPQQERCSKGEGAPPWSSLRASLLPYMLRREWLCPEREYGRWLGNSPRNNLQAFTSQLQALAIDTTLDI